MEQPQIPGVKEQLARSLGVFGVQLYLQAGPDGRLKRRELWVPDEATMQEHHDFLKQAYAVSIEMPYATAVPGAELLDNVKPHKQNNYFYMTDISDAFPSVDQERLLRTVESHVPAEAQALFDNFLRDYAFAPEADGLPLGAPASPYLFNLYCLPMDEAIGKYCKERGIAYTRYLDDLTFSSKQEIGQRKRRALRDIIHSQSQMEVNHQKSRLHELSRGPVTITGVSLYPDGRIQPSPQILQDARTVFEHVRDLIKHNLPVDTHTLGQVHGYYGAINQLSVGDPRVVRELNGLYGQVKARL